MVTNNRIWIVGAVIVMIAILLMGWFLGASPMLSQAAANDVQRASVESTNAGQEATLASIKEQFENIDALKAELAELQKALPPGSDLSTFIGELHDLEAASGVTITSITAGDAEEFVPAAPLVPEVVPEAAAEGADAAAPEAVVPEAEVAEVDPAVAAAAADAAALPVGEFIVIELTLVVSGTQAQVIDFIDAVQNGNRLFLVTGLTIAVDETDGTYQGTVPGNVYVLIDPSKPAVGESAEDEAALEAEETATP
jgi:hypothetical protein